MLLGLAGLVGISRMVVGLERREVLARSHAAQEERIRLALWRMDSALAPLVAQESSRPYFHFRALYPANAAYAHMYDRPAPGAAMLPSPLVVAETPQVRLHFQIDPVGRFSSPQVPDGKAAAAVDAHRLEEARARLLDLAGSLSRESLVARISSPQEEPRRAQVASPARPLRTAKAELEPDRSLPPSGPAAAPAAVQRAEEKAKELEAKGQVEAAKTVSEYAARARQQAASNEMAQQQNFVPPVPLGSESMREAKPSPARTEVLADAGRVAPASVQVAKSAQAGPPPALAGERDAVARADAPKQAKAAPAVLAGASRPAESRQPAAVHRVAFAVKETPFRPFWVENRLLLARTVSMPDGEYLQGCWLDWNAIRDSLRKAVADLLPAAELLPAAAGLDEPGRLLAALPVRLQPGPLPRLATDGLSPAILALVVGWACALVAGIAAAMLLQQALVLGERRGAFVSAVTHELRTPLTTFRMYAELLHLGMVDDESERKALLETLVVESDRLDHLVKNVLSFARLESGRGMASLQVVPVTDLLERGCERLSQRAAQAGMRVQIEVPEELAEASIRTDPSVVEQILFNLVDNACKYAAAGQDRRILIQAAPAGARLALRVRDHGPGIAKADRRKLFRPFHKSAREAARSAPGVGLGLALCRRLAHSLGGDLRLENGDEGGACFVLELPRVQDGH